MAKTNSKEFAKALTDAYALDPEKAMQAIMQHVERGWVAWASNPSKGGLPGYIKVEIFKKLRESSGLDNDDAIFGFSAISSPKRLSPKDSITEPTLLVDYQIQWEEMLLQSPSNFWVGSKEYKSKNYKTPIQYFQAYFSLNDYLRIYDREYWYKLALGEFDKRIKYEILRWEKAKSARSTPYIYKEGFYQKNCHAPTLKELADYAGKKIKGVESPARQLTATLGSAS